MLECVCLAVDACARQPEPRHVLLLCGLTPASLRASSPAGRPVCPARAASSVRLSANTIRPGQRGNHSRPCLSRAVHTAHPSRGPPGALAHRVRAPLAVQPRHPRRDPGTPVQNRLSRSVDCRKLRRRATARGSSKQLPTRAILPCASLALPSCSLSLPSRALSLLPLLLSYCLRVSPHPLLCHRLLAPLRVRPSLL